MKILISAMSEILNTIMQSQLQDIVRRIENIKKEQEELAESLRDIYKDAAYSGFDVKILREVIKRRNKKQEDVIEQEEMVSIYMNAIAMSAVNFHDPSDEV